MWISDGAIRNPVVTTALILALVAFGLLALLRLDTDEFPRVDPPVVAVAIPYPGASPETVERELIEPLEDGFSSISGVRHLTSTAQDGFATLVIEFEFSVDRSQASQDIRDKISELRQDLPPEAEEPVLTRFSPNDFPIVSLVLTSSTRPTTELTRLADPGLVGRLRGLPGVARVKVVGGTTRELSIELQPQALQAAGIGVQQVVQAVQTQSLAAPVGRVDGRWDERTIRLRGRMAGPTEFEDLVVASPGGRLVRLGELARISDGVEEPRSLALFDGQPAVGVEIVKATDASTTAVSERVRTEIEKMRSELPSGVTLRVVQDSGERVAQSVRDVGRTLVEGALLTVLVVFLFLASWRSTVITGLALPVSVLAGFVVVWWLGFTLNTMSLLGLSLAIGILIDDAIVVRENIVRHMERGQDHLSAAREGTSEIGLAVAATTFSIVVVFVPIAFMGGIAEQWFAPFALTIAAAVLVSLFVSFSLDPMLSALWPDPQVQQGARRGALTRRLQAFNRWFDRRTAGYGRLIGWALRHRLIMASLALLAFVGALALPAVGVVGSAFFPKEDRSEFLVRLETPPGSNLEYTLRKAQRTAALAQQLDGVAYTYTTVGGQGQAVDEALVYVRLQPRKARDRRQEVIEDELRQQVGRIGGVTPSLVTNWGPRKQIEVQLTGPDLAVLDRLAAEAAALVRQVPGALDVTNSTKGHKPELVVTLDRALAGNVGVTAGQLAQSLRAAFAGIDAGDWVDPDGETRDVRVRLAPEARTRPADLEALPLMLAGAGGGGNGNGSGGGGRANGAGEGSAPGVVTVPLGQVAAVTQTIGPVQIGHRDRERIVTIGANAGGRPLSEVVGQIDRKVAGLALPPGYAVRQGGDTEDQQEVFGGILTSLVIAVLLMYLVLVVQFRSFLDPVPILVSLPLSLIGVMLALVVTGSTLNLMSMIGVILLMGIVAKNAILLIDFAKEAERRGLPRREAIIEAGRVRLRPILMTSFAIIAGMIPVALGQGEGGDFRAPLGRAAIGGIITATLLTLLVIPTFYDTLAAGRERVLGWFQRRRTPAPSLGGGGDGELPAAARKP